jgi:hypothetical protein
VIFSDIILYKIQSIILVSINPIINLCLAARSMRNYSCGVDATHDDHHDLSHSNQLKTREDGCINGDQGDFISVDYTPARKKPPIHN